MKKDNNIILLLVAIVLVVSSLLIASHYESKCRELERRLKEVEEVDDWMMLQEAIALTESNFEEGAIGGGNALGIFQITPIYVDECNRLIKKMEYKHEDALNIEKSIEMFNIIQDYYNKDRDIDQALIHHNNAGWYKRKVKNNLEFIRRMEEVRRSIVDANRRRDLEKDE